MSWTTPAAGSSTWRRHRVRSRARTTPLQASRQLRSALLLEQLELAQHADEKAANTETHPCCSTKTAQQQCTALLQQQQQQRHKQQKQEQKHHHHQHQQQPSKRARLRQQELLRRQEQQARARRERRELRIDLATIQPLLLPCVRCHMPINAEEHHLGSGLCDSCLPSAYRHVTGQTENIKVVRMLTKRPRTRINLAFCGTFDNAMPSISVCRKLFDCRKA
eukprot:m.125937 g.125937  ORF g.125937 m.125937 type:complete len:221 (+) comp16665_c1_seq1:1017-1679(+)